MRLACTVAAILLAACGASLEAGTAKVKDDAGLRRAIQQAGPGSKILIAPGEYTGGLVFGGVRGTKRKPVTIGALDPERPPVIKGGTSGLQLSDPEWVVLEHLVIEGATGNGINIDDGGSYDSPAHHVTLRNLVVRDIGPRGNRDGIKLSGVKDFTIQDCVIERWGDRGSGIDMVGCHDGLIKGCTFRHGDTKGNNGVQTKGGTTDIKVYFCRFEHAGTRAVQLGGSTGREYFRPPLLKSGNAEARRIIVAGCEFIGSEAAVAFVSMEKCIFMHNTIYRPRRWVIRILMEAQGDDFIPCRYGSFAHNIVVWRRGDLRTTVNVGSGTEPDAFPFENNWWYCEDAPGESRPELPSREKGGYRGKNPHLEDPANGKLKPKPGSPIGHVGAESWSALEDR